MTRKDEGDWSERMFGGGRACRWFEELLCCFAPAARRPDEVLLVPKLRALRDRGKLNQLLGLDLREPRLHFATRRSHAPLLSHKDYTTTRGPSQGISNRSSLFLTVPATVLTLQLLNCDYFQATCCPGTKKVRILVSLRLSCW